MEPIAQLSPARAGALIGVCFDVDDTVTSHGTLDPDAYRSLFALRASGLKLIAVTGRPLGFAEIIARMWPVDAAVGENGAGYIAKVGGTLRTSYWDPEPVRAAQQAQLARLRAEVAAALPQIAVSSDGWARRCDLAFDVGEQASHSRAEIDALVNLIEQAGARASVSSIHVHAQLGSHDKAQGVVQVARELWGSDDAAAQRGLMFIGDSGNDAAAFAYFDLTAGVANVARHLDRLPRAPRYVARAAFGAGFAEIAEVLVRARQPAP